MTFTHNRANLKFIGPPIHGARYTLLTGDSYHVSTVKTLQYLGVYLDHRLDWTHHVTIMANRARSTIQGVNLLGNSVQGLDFLNCISKKKPACTCTYYALLALIRHL
jgi:hypothetical protein